MKRVLVVDDSAFARKLVKDVIDSSGEFILAGTAANGRDALARIEELRPDVITLDIEMPIMDGLETLAQIMLRRPTPVVMLSSLTTEGAAVSLSALELGAVDVVAKPISHGLPQLQTIAGELLAKLSVAAQVDVTRLADRSHRGTRRIIKPSTGRLGPVLPIVVIASSTGGPRALRRLIPELSMKRSAFYVVIQHLPVGFTGAMVHSMNMLTPLNVREAEPGDWPIPDTLLVAPSGRHCAFGRNGKITLTDDPTLWGVRPAADVTMCTAGVVFGSRVIGVVLTGMGRDGANGLSVIKENGGKTLAEHESTCIIYGMPKAAAETGAVDRVVPLDDMAGAIAVCVESVSRANAA